MFNRLIKIKKLVFLQERIENVTLPLPKKKKEIMNKYFSSYATNILNHLNLQYNKLTKCRYCKISTYKQKKQTIFMNTN